MHSQPYSTVLFAAVALALGALAACENSKTNEYQMESAAGTVVDEGEWIRDSMLTDASIMGALQEASEAEIDASEVAKNRASDSEVRMYAMRMIEDHKRLDDRGDSLAKALDINVKAPPDVLEDMHDAEIDSLKKIDKDTSSTASAFDRAYIDHQVRAHRQVLDLVDLAIERAERPELKTALQNEVRPAVASHLQRAEAMQKRITPTASPVR